MWDVPIGGDAGIHPLILNDQAFNSGKNLLTWAHSRCICELGGLFWANSNRRVVRKVGWAIQNQQLRLTQMIRWRGGCTEFNPNIPCSSSDLCTLVAYGNNEEDAICEYNRGVIKRLRFCGRKYGGCDPDPRLSSAREGNKDEDTLHEDDGCFGSWLSQRCKYGW